MKLGGGGRKHIANNWKNADFLKCCVFNLPIDDSKSTELSEYSEFVAKVLNQPKVKSSTVAVWSDSPYTGIAEGEVLFTNGLRLRMREEMDFETGLIVSYGYEVYRSEERLYWYDDFPHPNDPTLAATMPHHKHIPPDIKRHRVPAPNISFTQPNLPILIEEIEKVGNG